MINFFKLCVDCGWLQKNPAAAMRRVKADPVPTDYFPPEGFEKILEATKRYRDPDYEEVHNQATRLRILVLLMRWSGLRISDAVTLERTRLVGNNLRLYRAKTGLPVYVPLPPESRKACVLSHQVRSRILAIFSGPGMETSVRW